MHQMYAYAEILELCDKDYSEHVKIKIPDDDEHGVAFTDEELKTFWKSQDDQTAEMMLIMCYSGFRINEYRNLEINFKDGYFRGGSKTAAGKNRIVPIHSAIVPLVKSVYPVTENFFQSLRVHSVHRWGNISHSTISQIILHMTADILFRDCVKTWCKGK